MDLQNIARLSIYQNLIKQTTQTYYIKKNLSNGQIFILIPFQKYYRLPVSQRTDFFFFNNISPFMFRLQLESRCDLKILTDGNPLPIIKSFRGAQGIGRTKDCLALIPPVGVVVESHLKVPSNSSVVGPIQGNMLPWIGPTLLEQILDHRSVFFFAFLFNQFEHSVSTQLVSLLLGPFLE